MAIFADRGRVVKVFYPVFPPNANAETVLKWLNSVNMHPMKTHITFETLILRPKDVVYKTVTTSEGWDGFFTSGMRLDLRVGGEILFRWKDWGPEKISYEERAVVREVVQSTRFSFDWHPLGENQPTNVTIDLEDRGDATKVVLRETGYPETEEGLRTMVACATGWGEAMTLLKFYLEHGVTYFPKLLQSLAPNTQKRGKAT